MTVSKSEAVRARQAAMDRLMARERGRLEQIAEAAAEVDAAHRWVSRSREELEAAEGTLRARLAQLRKLDQSVEQIADLCGLDPVVIRSALRAPATAAAPANAIVP